MVNTILDMVVNAPQPPVNAYDQPLPWRDEGLWFACRLLAEGRAVVELRYMQFIVQYTAQGPWPLYVSPPDTATQEAQVLSVLQGAVDAHTPAAVLAAMDVQRILLLLENKGLLRSAAYLHHLRGDVDAALRTYAQLPTTTHPHPIFSYITHHIDDVPPTSPITISTHPTTSPTPSPTTIPNIPTMPSTPTTPGATMAAAVLRHAVTLTRIDAVATAHLMMEYMPGHHVAVLEVMQEYPQLQFAYLKVGGGEVVCGCVYMCSVCICVHDDRCVL